MKILLTGPFGNVGLSTLEEIIKRNYKIIAFDIKNKKNKKLAKKFENQIEIVWGDLRNYEDVQKAVKGVDIIIHLAAIIPPLADKLPELAEEVNVGGTRNIVKAIINQNNKPKLIFTSSIAVYGDRRKNPIIKLTDLINPSKEDYYA
ncbi:MAG: NAD-dependent epimerase/dehydratase family protein, partial [Candidatus Hodarchaeota archaeon]